MRYQFYGQGSPLLDVLPPADSLRVTAVQRRSELQLTWSTEPSDFCSPNYDILEFMPAYDRPASLAIIAGVYSDGELTLSINSDGAVSGSDINNCVFNGNVAVVHADRNYYDATIDVDNCTGHESLEGIAFFYATEDATPNRWLRLAVANSQHAMWLQLEK